MLLDHIIPTTTARPAIPCHPHKMLRRATTSSIAAAGAAKPASSSLMLRRTLTTSPLIRGPWSGSVSSSSSQLKHYVIFAEDVEEGGEGLRRRLQVRPEHLAGAREGKESGRIELGGGLLGVDHSEVGEDGPARHLKGSLFVVLGEVRMRRRGGNEWYTAC